jgi:putative ABC transport system substrate-binding protein
MSKKIGFLVAAEPKVWHPYCKAFEEELKGKGWTIGPGAGAKDVSIDYEPTDNTGTVIGASGNANTYAIVANQFVSNPVDVIVTAGNAAALACKIATQSQANPTPVVFASVGDPLGCGLVQNLSPPGGNLTGCSNGQVDLLSYRIDAMINNLKPTVVGLIGNPNVCPVDTAMISALQLLKNQNPPLTAYAGYITQQSEIQTVINDHATKNVDCLFVFSDPLLSANAHTFVPHAQGKGMRTMHEFSESVTLHGGDLSFGPDFPTLFSKAADFVDQILSGTNPPGALNVYTPKQGDCKLVKKPGGFTPRRVRL